MEFRQLQYFVKAAETLHFTEAAGELYVTQSTLSQQIKQLEEELGSLLFDRIGKHVQLTEAGRIFLEHAQRILAEVEKGKQAIADLNNVLAGELRIGVTYAFTSLLLPVLSPFSLKYPGIKLIIEYGTTEELVKKLYASGLDFVLAFQQPASQAEFNMQLLYSSKIVMVVSKKNALANSAKISLEELARQELILPGKGFSSREFLDEVFRKRNIRPQIKIEINDVHSLLTMVEAGKWVTILNERALVGWKNLVAVPIAGKELYMDSFILWQKGAYRKKAATLFINELMKVV
jgi:LysR family cyn operon transcriptional activator